MVVTTLVKVLKDVERVVLAVGSGVGAALLALPPASPLQHTLGGVVLGCGVLAAGLKGALAELGK